MNHAPRRPGYPSGTTPLRLERLQAANPGLLPALPDNPGLEDPIPLGLPASLPRYEQLTLRQQRSRTLLLRAVLFTLVGLLQLGILRHAKGAESQLPEPPHVPAYSYDVWQVEDGWVPNAVTAIVQSRDGYIWLATYQGLVRFDGVRFAFFDSVHTPGLQNSRITALYQAEDGTLWIGHETGELTRMVAGKFYPANPGSTSAQSRNSEAGRPGGAIDEIVCDANQDLWVLNETGVLMRLRDGQAVAPAGGLALGQRAAVCRTKDGRLWMAANGQISLLQEGQLSTFRFPDATATDFFVRAAAAGDGGLWVVGNGRIRKWLQGRWALDLGECPCGYGAVTAMMETRSGALLIGTLTDGLYMMAPGAQSLHFSRTNGLSQDWIRGLCEDREGNIWVGTGAGLNALRARKVKMLDPPDHWQGRAVISFTVQPDGAAWIGTEGGGLYYHSNATWLTYGESSGLSNLFVWSTLQTRAGDLLVGTWGGGLLVKKNDRFESLGELAKITEPVVSLFEDRAGEIWIGTTHGIYRYHAGKLVWFAGKDQLSLPDVRSIAQTPDGAIWFGLLGGGLACFKDGALKQFRKQDGLSSDFIQTLAVQADGTLWAGTSDNGLARRKDGKFAAIGPAQGLPASVICGIVDDGVGHFWIGSNRGIFRVARADLEKCADGAAKSVSCLNFGKSEGMASLICSGGFQPGACRTPQGLLWFPTAKGVAMIDPMNVASNPYPPPVLIEELLVDRQVIEGQSAGSVLTIPPGKHRFEMHYTGLSFAAPEKVRFRHRLEELENDWIEDGTKRVAEYSYLSPGTYTFHVIACNNDDVWNETGDSLSFKVLPQIWQTWWFRGLSLLAGASAVAAAVAWLMRRRALRRLEQLERQRAIERERARIARDIHDDLGASLTHVTLLSESARGELEAGHPAAADVDEIFSTARELTRAMDEIVWAVNPEHDTLDSLVAYLGRFAEHFLTGTGLGCRLDVPMHLPALTLTAEVRHSVFLALKEALNNVVKHAQATEVRISLELNSHGFVLVVADNGCGFDRGRLDKQTPPAAADATRAGSGNGLRNMQRRLAELGGRCEWDTAPHEGTRVRMVVVLKP